MLQFKALFEIYLFTSIKGAILILLVLVIQRFFRKDFTARWIYVLWMLALIRLLLPFTPLKTSLSLYNLGLIKKITFRMDEVLLGNLASASDRIEMMGKTIPIESFIENTFSMDWLQLGGLIWLVGVFLLLMLFAYVHYQIQRMLRNATPCTNEALLLIVDACCKKIRITKRPTVYHSTEISTPMTCGIVTPIIVLPHTTQIPFDAKKFEHIFLHELVHIRRRDVFFTTLSILICILHWFNPLVWIGFLRSKKDCELACDEAVLEYLSQKEYKQYGLTLIQLLESTSKHRTVNPLITKTIIHNRAEANARIFQISVFHRKRKPFIILSILFLLVITLIGINEPSSIRTFNVYSKLSLSDYLSFSEGTVYETLAKKPIHTYVVKSNHTPFYILHYTIQGEKTQFWYDAQIGNHTKKTLEITTTAYKGMRQGMTAKQIEKITTEQSIPCIAVQHTPSLIKNIYEDIDCLFTVIYDIKTNRVYSISLQER